MGLEGAGGAGRAGAPGTWQGHGVDAGCDVDLPVTLTVCLWLQVHRSNRPIICKGCRRTFTSHVSQGLRRFGLCDSCTCMTDVHEDDNDVMPINLSLAEVSSEGQEKSDTDSDWPIYVESGEENDPAGEDSDEKPQMWPDFSDRETLT